MALGRLTTRRTAARLMAVALVASTATITLLPATGSAGACTLVLVNPSGSNSWGNEYKVSSEADLAQVGAVCGLNSYYALQNDITLTAPAPGGSNHTPIGTLASPFTGGFFGNLHTITGLVINNPGTPYQGLFGYVGDAVYGHDRAVWELTLADAAVVGGDYTGTMVGYAYKADLYDLHASGTATVGSSGGGLVGHNFKSGSPYLTSSVDVTAATGAERVGGLIGEAAGDNAFGFTLQDSSASGSVTSAGDYVGGLIGKITLGVDLENVEATGDVTGDDYVGGLVGATSTDNGIGCPDFAFTVKAEGDVTATGSYVGGLIGATMRNDPSHIACIAGYSGASASGDVTTTGSGVSSVGGLVGLVAPGMLLWYATASGDVTASGADEVGGLFGHIEGSETPYASASGDVTGASHVGGLIGTLVGGSGISQALGTGSVTGTSNVGGLIGTLDGATVTNSTTRNTVTGTSNTGGLIGEVVGSGNTVSNSYSRATVTSGGPVGGLIGRVGTDIDSNTGTLTLTNSYAAGTTTASSGTGAGLVAEVAGDATVTPTALFWDATTTTQGTSATGTSKTTAEMKAIATFTGGSWNIAEGFVAAGYTWLICPAGNDGYPFLRWEALNANFCVAKPVWTDDTLAAMYKDISVSDGVTASGDPTIAYAVSAGTLPDGLTLNTTTGAITGSPTTVGPYDFTLTASNGGGSVSKQFTGSITVRPVDIALDLEFETGANIRDGLQTTTVAGDGLKPLSTYTVVMAPVVSAGSAGFSASAAVQLGTGTTDADGSFDDELLIPAGTPAGAYSLTVYGTSPADTQVTDVAYFSLDASGLVTAVSEVAPTPPPTLPETGADTWSAILLAALMALAGIALQRFSRRPTA